MAIITRLIRFLRIGVGISDTDVEYADSTSSTVAPTTGWQTTAPKWQNGHFIWSRTRIYYTNGLEKVSNPVCLPSGKGVVSIVEQYYQSSSSSSLTGGTWVSNKAPAYVEDKFIWTRSVITYTDGSSTATDAVCVTGSKGDKGDKGDKGSTGSVLRGPQLWNTCINGYIFEAGGEGEDWKDSVLYNGNTYSCIKTHVKTADNYPGSEADQNNHYWRLGQSIELLIAHIILTQYQMVENLGVRTIEMKDKDGNIVFKAKDGDLVCKGGIFQNVSVSGDVSVGRLRYNENTVTDGTSVINGSFIMGWGTYVLPHLKDGEFMRIVVFNPVISRNTMPAVLKGEQTGDDFMPAQMSFSHTKETTIEVYGWYELIGTNLLGHTRWVYSNVENNQ
ncbi:hypothetical protein [Segatella sp.]|jgi:hypothetical protein|uniref:hypothetical protein n=1 Tax=Segatella sp. TaxID=2974253 RepID=UPI003077D8B4